MRSYTWHDVTSLCQVIQKIYIMGMKGLHQSVQTEGQKQKLFWKYFWSRHLVGPWWIVFNNTAVTHHIITIDMYSSAQKCAPTYQDMNIILVWVFFRDAAQSFFFREGIFFLMTPRYRETKHFLYPPTNSPLTWGRIFGHSSCSASFYSTIKPLCYLQLLRKWSIDICVITESDALKWASVSLRSSNSFWHCSQYVVTAMLLYDVVYNQS